MTYAIVAIIVALLFIFVAVASQSNGNKPCERTSPQPKITVSITDPTESQTGERKEKREYRIIKVKFFDYDRNGEPVGLRRYLDHGAFPDGQEYNFKVPKDFDCSYGDVLSGESRFDSYSLMVVTNPNAHDDYSGYTKVLKAEAFRAYGKQLVPLSQLHDAITLCDTQKLPIFDGKFVSVSNIPSPLLDFTKELVERSGGTLQAPVTKRVAYLIEIDRKNESKKLSKAKELNTPVLYLSDIISLCRPKE